MSPKLWPHVDLILKIIKDLSGMVACVDEVTTNVRHESLDLVLINRGFVELKVGWSQ